MSKYYVICGNRAEFIYFMRDKMTNEPEMRTRYPNTRDWICVTSPNSVRGCTIEHGSFYGNWRNLPDLEELFVNLLHRTDIASNTHRIINRVWAQWKEENNKYVSQ